MNTIRFKYFFFINFAELLKTEHRDVPYLIHHSAKEIQQLILSLAQAFLQAFIADMLAALFSDVTETLIP